MEDRMAFYGEQYLRQISNAKIEQLKDRGIEPKRKKVMASYANQEKRILQKLLALRDANEGVERCLSDARSIISVLVVRKKRF
jgi:hypothetical protein